MWPLISYLTKMQDEEEEKEEGKTKKCPHIPDTESNIFMFTDAINQTCVYQAHKRPNIILP